MSKRIALFATEKELEDYFGIRIEESAQLEARYNIAPSQSIPVIVRKKNDSEPGMDIAVWGLENGKKSLPVIEPDNALEGLESGKYSRCVIPVSGFYMWKEKGKRMKNPFFVRMLNQPLMPLAGVTETNGKKNSCAFIQMNANALIQPLDEKMPLQLSEDLTDEWLSEDEPAEIVLEKAAGQFLMTEMTVLRVSSKVNDLSQNSPDLIQPLPK